MSEDNNVDDGNKYALTVNIRRKYDNSLSAVIIVDPRDMGEGLAILNVLAEAQKRALDYVNGESNINYNCREVRP